MQALYWARQIFFGCAYFQIQTFLLRVFPRSLKHLDASGCAWMVDNTTMSTLGQTCPSLQYLDIQGCDKVSDVGIQCLVFPEAVLRRGEVNLANPRIRTNPLTRHLRVSVRT